jgi:hypothetical protein
LPLCASADASALARLCIEAAARLQTKGATAQLQDGRKFPSVLAGMVAHGRLGSLEDDGRARELAAALDVQTQAFGILGSPDLVTVHGW